MPPLRPPVRKNPQDPPSDARLQGVQAADLGDGRHLARSHQASAAVLVRPRHLPRRRPPTALPHNQTGRRRPRHLGERDVAAHSQGVSPRPRHPASCDAGHQLARAVSNPGPSSSPARRPSQCAADDPVVVVAFGWGWGSSERGGGDDAAGGGVHVALPCGSYGLGASDACALAPLSHPQQTLPHAARPAQTTPGHLASLASLLASRAPSLLKPAHLRPAQPDSPCLGPGRAASPPPEATPRALGQNAVPLNATPAEAHDPRTPRRGVWRAVRNSPQDAGHREAWGEATLPPPSPPKPPDRSANPPGGGPRVGNPRSPSPKAIEMPRFSAR